MASTQIEIHLAPESIVQQRNANFHERFAHVIGAAGIVVISRAVGAQAAQGTEAAVDGRICAGFVDGGRG